MQQRLPWVDFARGLCIILVVLLHFHGVLFSHLEVPESAKSLSDAISSAARPARMPTFFFISGFLASRALERPWRQIFDGRITLLYWTYLLWSVIATFTLFALYEPASWENTRRFAEQVAVQAVYARQSTWFLYGLIVFFVAARLLRRWSTALFAVSLTGSAFSEHIPDLVTSEMVRTLPYFLAGIYMPRLFTVAAGEPNWKRCALLAFFYAATVLPILFARELPGIWLPATAVGIVLVLSISRTLDGLRGSEVIRYVGRNTLPIYVMHISLLLVARVFLEDWLVLETPLALCFWLFGNVAILALCLGLHYVFMRCGLAWLFTLPKPLRIASHAPASELSVAKEPVSLETAETGSSSHKP